MHSNMGTIDKGVRLTAAAIVAVLFFAGQFTGIAAAILLIVAGIFVLTSFISFCPLYLPLGISTRKTPETEPRK